MAEANKKQLKIAVLDLYDGIENEGMGGIGEVLQRYKAKHHLSYEVFDVRKKCEMADTNFDIYISSGGPGNPLDTEGSEWEKKYFNLIDKLEDHNLSNTSPKKYGFFICHSFQLLCRRYKLGHINNRRSGSFGVLPVHKTPAGLKEPVFQGLEDPFYAVDSRDWQVIHPDEKRFTELGMQLLAIEKIRPNVHLPRAMMAIRYSDYFFGTQFHPEASSAGMKLMLAKPQEKKEVVDEHGLDKYNEMLELLNEPDKIIHTQKTMIPNFLDEAVKGLRG